MFIAAAVWRGARREGERDERGEHHAEAGLALDAVLRQRLDERPLGLHLVVPVHRRGVAEDVGAAVEDRFVAVYDAAVQCGAIQTGTIKPRSTRSGPSIEDQMWQMMLTRARRRR